MTPSSPSRFQPKAFRSFAKTCRRERQLDERRPDLHPRTARRRGPSSTPSSLGGTNWWPMSFNPRRATCTSAGWSRRSSSRAGSRRRTRPVRSSPAALRPAGEPDRDLHRDRRLDQPNRLAEPFPRLVLQRFDDYRRQSHLRRPQRRAPPGLRRQQRQPLWSFQTGAGANNTATVFSLDGKEVVAFYAAGSALAGSAHGDDLWLFGLDGKLGPAKAATPAGAGEHVGEKKSTTRRHPHGSDGQVGETEFKFALSTQTVHTGTVTFKLMNNGGIPHNLHIDGKQTPNINPGQSTNAEGHLHEARQIPLPVHAPRPRRGRDERRTAGHVTSRRTDLPSGERGRTVAALVRSTSPGGRDLRRCLGRRG